MLKLKNKLLLLNALRENDACGGLRHTMGRARRQARQTMHSATTGIRGMLAAVLLLMLPLAPAASQTVEAARADTLTVGGVISVSPSASAQPFMALRTNLLYDVLLVSNIGVEVSLGRRWTAGADWFATWLYSDRRHRYWQGYGGYLSLRRYFGRAAADCPFSGHHLGAYALGLTYDFEWGGRGYQAARFGFGGGAEYGYAASIGRRLRLDLSIGAGFQGGEYKEYLPADDGTGHYVWQSTRRRHWWGPTKAEITIKWLLGPLKEKKGGTL